MRKVFVMALGALAIGGGILLAMDNPVPKVKCEKYKLANGLTVFLVEDHSVPIVGVNVNYMVGSKNERVGRTGFAHLFEHMMFQGSKHYDKNYFEPLQDVGGSVNGGTNTDRTRYWELVPAGYLERALYLESDRMGFLLDAMTQARLDNQRSVVQNERRQNYENRPYGTVQEKVAAVMYPPNHPYSWTTIGSMADLQAATLEDVKDFFRTYYAPNNASVCIAGDFDVKHAKDLVEKYFGAIPPGPPVAKLDRWVPELSGEVSLAIQDRVQLPRTYVAWLTVPVYSGDDAALDVFGHVVGGGKTSRLYQRLVYDQQIAQDAAAFHRASQIAGTFGMMLTPRPGHTLDEVEKAAFAVLTEALDKGVTTEEVERVKTAVTADFVRSMQNVGGFSGISDKLNEYYHYLGEADMFRWDLQRYLDVTPASATATARKYITANRVIARVMPLGKMAPSESALAKGVTRDALPGKGAESAFKLPARERFKLANGLEVVLVEWHKVPIVEANLIVRGGASADPAGRAGLASLTATLMQEGAAGRTSKQIAEEIESLGAELSVNADTDATFARLSALKEKLEGSFALLADVVTKPDFPAEELNRQRARRLVQLKQMQDRPEYLAQVATLKVLFGDHPYGHPATGAAKDVEAITLDDVKSYWKSQFVPNNAALVVVGDVTRQELEAGLAKSLGAWQGGRAPVLKLAAAKQHGERAIYLVDKPGAAQSVFGAAQIGVARSTKDYAALELANTAFGGGFISRLNLNLRETKGYTYGARSRFEFSRAPGAFTAGAPVQTAVTAAAIGETVKELEGLTGKKPLEAKELAYAQGTITNGYARRFETPGQIARELVDTVLYGLPDDAVEAYPNQVQAVTLADANAAVAHTIVPARMAIIVVGDRAAIRAELEKLQVGPIVELDTNGNPLTTKPAK